MFWRVVTCALIAALWIRQGVIGEKDSNDCNFYYEKEGWREAVQICTEVGMRLMCYKSEKVINDIAANFRLTLDVTPYEAFWLSSRSCSRHFQREECLSVHIHETDGIVWHSFQFNCLEKYPFVCCNTDVDETTTSTAFSTTINVTSDVFDISSLSTTTRMSSTVKSPFCKKVDARGIQWPDTEAGTVAIRPCPGNSKGNATWECEQHKISRWKESGPDLTKCRSKEIQNLKERFNSSSASHVISELEQIFGDERKEIFGQDLADVIFLMTALPDRLFNELESLTNSSRWSPAEDSVDKVMSVVNSMVKLEYTWNDIEEKGRAVAGTHLLSTVDGMGSLLANSLPENQDKHSIFRENIAVLGISHSKLLRVDGMGSLLANSLPENQDKHSIFRENIAVLGISHSKLLRVDGMGSLLANSLPENQDKHSIFRENIALQVMKPKLGESVSLPEWTDTSNYNHRGNVMLEKGYDSKLVKDEGNISLVFALYTDMSSILSPSQEENNKTSSLNSAVVSTTVVQGRKSVEISSKVRIVLEHLTANPNNSGCVFWNMEKNRWDSFGCSLEDSNETYSVCVCNHLTNFGLLMDYRNTFKKSDHLPLHTITAIGCCLSIVCLTICIIVFSCYSYHSRHSWGFRYVIHRNLCFTLLIANLLLVFGLDRTEDKRACSIIAGLLHYFFLSAFSWMLLEGVHIYLLLIVVFASRKSHSEKYYIFGYGFPLLVVTITAISRPMYYGTDEICWLSTEKGTIWGFLGPVAAILILNTAALILAQYKASRISIKDDRIALLKRWLRVTFILFPVLGITWVFGFFYFGKRYEVAGYLFVFFNSFQGVFIFFFHCLLDKKARNMVMDSFKKKNTSINTGSSGTQKKKEHHQNGVPFKSNSITPVENDGQSPSNKQKAFQIRSDKKKRNWFKWHKPWSFCFEMSVSDKSSPKQDSPPQAIVVQWNSLNDKNCL